LPGSQYSGPGLGLHTSKGGLASVKEGYFSDRGSEWLVAHRQLLVNVKAQNYTPPSDIAVSRMVKGCRVSLPAYIPYIGPDYFRFRPRVLCFAINQNLSRHTPWTQAWVSKWAEDLDLARDRLNRSALLEEPLPIKPYAEGFIPFVALLGIQLWVQKRGGELPRFVDEVIAVTNFIKFSTKADANSSSIPSLWWKECSQRYAEPEISALKPDLIIAFGQTTSKHVNKIIKKLNLTPPPFLFECRFPSRIASDKGRPLTIREEAIWANDFAPLLKRVKVTQHNSYHKWKIHTYRGYFIDVYTKMNTYLNIVTSN